MKCISFKDADRQTDKPSNNQALSQTFGPQVINQLCKNYFFKIGVEICNMHPKPCMSNLVVEFFKVSALIAFFK